MELIYKGSVKDLYKNGDSLVFNYSNRYSIFDWGEMPNEIPMKGAALASMAASFFEYLSNKGIPSHFVKATGENTIAVKAVKVLRPEWYEGQYDYSVYKDVPTNCLVPLEVIFRKFLGQGNSLEGRLKKNPSYLQDLQLTEMPNASTVFNPALIEFSTKLETSDRYLSRAEIAQMNIVSEEELKNLRLHTQAVVQELEKLFASFGVKLWDGKLEFAFGDKGPSGARTLLLVDSIGPDELRLTYEGLPLSKEFLRQLYAPTSWHSAVKKAKEMAQERKTQDWKGICREELREVPQSLNAAQIEVSSLLYQALANEVASVVGRKKPFAEELNLKQWHQKAQKVLES
ncbi:phosphoribosylaminoimidazole succinocarboxamide synthase [Bdellovibrio bacteriovorus]|uniref:Phosphoribosylaminoimidazole-succinocarboxamide synthase n=1 Tax=Bdellovibrio bacteriovorus TaxID=959 RepID=A0A162GHV4_BDEBC|nr:phosphoribosylaminoimidazolesuccinocarboxamide synthase [Bdellovibrio bacteriovorus]KYG68187.1 phosphoribosylaminoimidazole succinocarboxamide synthase [Bdellovibrio bacteriovorus]